MENRQKKMEMSEKDGRKQSLNYRKDSHAKEQEKWERGGGMSKKMNEPSIINMCVCVCIMKGKGNVLHQYVSHYITRY